MSAAPDNGVPAHIRPTRLGYFVAVAEAGQISRAARQLHIAQPALSQAIARLEAQLGLQLLERHARGVSLTPAGVIMLERARAAVAAEEQALDTARALMRDRRGLLELGFHGSPPSLLLPEAIAALRAAHSDVELCFRELGFPGRVQSRWLADVDLAVCYAISPEDGVEAETLWMEPRALVVHDTHPLAPRSELLVAEALEETFCGNHPATDPSWAALWSLDDHRGGPPQRLTADRPANALELIAAMTSGLAVRAFPSAVARSLADFFPQLIALPLHDVTPISCSLIWHEPLVNSVALSLLHCAREAAALRDLAA